MVVCRSCSFFSLVSVRDRTLELFTSLFETINFSFFLFCPFRLVGCRVFIFLNIPILCPCTLTIPFSTQLNTLFSRVQPFLYSMHSHIHIDRERQRERETQNLCLSDMTLLSLHNILLHPHICFSTFISCVSVFVSVLSILCA